MFRGARIEPVTKAAILFTLLTFSMIVQAGPADITGSGGHMAKADND